jgi:hypothetical protein
MKLRSVATIDQSASHHNMASLERGNSVQESQQRADSPTLTSSDAEI